MEPKPESGLEFASPEPLPIEPIGLDEFLAIAKANPFHRGISGISWRLAVEVADLKKEVQKLNDELEARRGACRE